MRDRAVFSPFSRFATYRVAPASQNRDKEFEKIFSLPNRLIPREKEVPHGDFPPSPVLRRTYLLGEGEQLHVGKCVSLTPTLLLRRGFGGPISRRERKQTGTKTAIQHIT